MPQYVAELSTGSVHLVQRGPWTHRPSGSPPRRPCLLQGQRLLQSMAPSRDQDGGRPAVEFGGRWRCVRFCTCVSLLCPFLCDFPSHFRTSAKKVTRFDSFWLLLPHIFVLVEVFPFLKWILTQNAEPCPTNERQTPPRASTRVIF